MKKRIKKYQVYATHSNGNTYEGLFDCSSTRKSKIAKRFVDKFLKEFKLDDFTNFAIYEQV